MSRERARQLASDFQVTPNPTGWFEVLYAEAGNNYAEVPWADLAPNPNLVDWVTRQNLVGEGRKAIAIACGYGDDAEFLASIGFQVVAFDISPTAIAECKRRFQNSPVSYQVGDLLNPPRSWFQEFDFVLESYTLQALPSELRIAAISKIRSFVAPLGQLLIITRGREESDPLGDLPYPLTKCELGQFEELGLERQLFEDFLDSEISPVRRFRVLYTGSSLT